MFKKEDMPFIEIERYVGFITRNKLSQRQFLFLYLLKRERYDLIKKYLDVFPAEEPPAGEPRKFLSTFERDDLVARELLKKIGDGISSDNYKVGNKIDELFIDTFGAAKELVAAYPSYIVGTNGQKFPCKYMDSYQLAAIYGERIGYEVAEHKEVLKDIEYARDNGLIQASLEKFVRSEYWHIIREQRLGNINEIKSNGNINTFL